MEDYTANKRIFTAEELSRWLGIWPEGLDYLESTGRFPKPDLYDGVRGYNRFDRIFLGAIIEAARRRYARKQEAMLDKVRHEETSSIRSGVTVEDNDEQAA